MTTDDKIMRAIDVLNAASGTTRVVEVGFISSSHIFSCSDIDTAWKNGVKYAIDVLQMDEKEISEELRTIRIENIMIPDDNMFAERVGEFNEDEDNDQAWS